MDCGEATPTERIDAWLDNTRSEAFTHFMDRGARRRIRMLPHAEGGMPRRRPGPRDSRSALGTCGDHILDGVFGISERGAEGRGAAFRSA